MEGEAVRPPMKMQGSEKARKSQEGVIGEEENLNRLGGLREKMRKGFREATWT